MSFRGSMAVIVLVLFAGCGGVWIEVGTRSLAEARRAWEATGIRDYEIEWTSAGAREGRYRVSVRGGEVTRILSIQPDGKETAARPADPSYYGVEGLFRVIEEELEEALGERPFGQPPGTHVLQRFVPDPRYGFPRSYRRDVAGTRRGLAIDVVQFAPTAPTNVPSGPTP